MNPDARDTPGDSARLEVEVEVVASPGAADERLLVLEAAGIHASLRRGAFGFEIVVPVEQAEHARRELQAARGEVPLPPARRAVAPHAGGLAAAAAYAGVLAMLFLASGADAFGRDWFAVGMLDGPRVRGGELWRAVTALTLHADFAHFAANAGFGVLFGAMAGGLYGAGVAWLLVVGAATGANLLEAFTLAGGRVSLGASTAVFAALGAVAAYRWPEGTFRTRWLWRGANAIAGLVLLAMLGTGDARTDVLAHALGFGCGALAAVGLQRRGAPRGRRVQLVAGAIAVALVAVAWSVALLA
jgi:rhomboid protease GluP